MYPLSDTLDQVGSIANSTRCCAILDSVMSGVPHAPLPLRNPRGLRIAAVRNYVLNDMPAMLSSLYEQTLDRLADAGALVDRVLVPALDDIPQINAKGGFPAPELYSHLRGALDSHAAMFDPRVLRRINRGAIQNAADYLELRRARATLIERADAQLEAFDVMAMPTTPMIAPRFAEVEADEDFDRINLMALRNPTVANLLDRPAISLPCGYSPEGMPFAISLMGRHGEDRVLLGIAAELEQVVAARALRTRSSLCRGNRLGRIEK